LDLSQSEIVSRHHPSTGGRQLLTTSILKLLRRRLPGDCFALLGITMVDLYLEPAWNFVFGQADVRYRVGVCRFARYNPRFYGQVSSIDSRASKLQSFRA